MKYILALVIGSAIGLASAQNADLQNKDIVASRRQSRRSTTRTRASVSTPPTHGAATSNKLNQELERIERENVKPRTGKAVRPASTGVAKSADQDEKNTKPMNFGHRDQTVRNNGSNNRGKR